MRFVLDASVALLWLVPGTNPAGVDGAEAKVEAKAIVTEVDSQRYVALGQLDIVTDAATGARALCDTLNLARRYRLSAYDAAYLELALRTGLPLATLDAGLLRATTTAGDQILGTH